ncbi:MAG: hypothetical protein PVH88_11555 [Ignavibacteria bacterium]|jgi:hypothetical protein
MTSMCRTLISLLGFIIIISSLGYSYNKLSNLQDELDEKQKMIAELPGTQKEQTQQQLNEQTSQQPVNESPIDLAGWAAIITAALTGIAAIISAFALQQSRKQKIRAEELNYKQEELAKKMEIGSLADTFKDIINENEFRKQFRDTLINKDTIEIIKDRGKFIANKSEEFEEALRNCLLKKTILLS